MAEKITSATAHKFSRYLVFTEAVPHLCGQEGQCCLVFKACPTQAAFRIQWFCYNTES